jgi:hypothetical protein
MNQCHQNNDNNQMIYSSQPVMSVKYPSAVNVNNTQYPQGVINPIQKKTISTIVNIDSLFRPNYNDTTSSNFIWDFIQPETNIVSMRVSSVDMPVMWYAITDKMNRNQFDIHLYNMNGLPDATYTITIPPGNYMTTAFIDTLNMLFQKQGGGLEYLMSDISQTSAKTIIRAIDKDDIIADTNGLLTHAAFDPANAYYAPNFSFTLNMFPNKNQYPLNNALYEFQRTVGFYMGFRQYEYLVQESDTITQITYDPFHKSLFYQCAIESESAYSSTRDNYIFLSINDYNSNCICQSVLSSKGSSYIGNNILARITVDTIHNSIIYDNGSDNIFKERVYMGPVTIDKLNIRLMNRYGEDIDLNLNNFSFTLEFTKLYQVTT